MKKTILAIVVILTIGLTVTSCKCDAKKEATEKTTEAKTAADNNIVTKTENNETAMVKYQCPMKCEGDKTYDKAGSCPVCKMDLKEVKHDHDQQQNHDH